MDKTHANNDILHVTHRKKIDFVIYLFKYTNADKSIMEGDQNGK